MGKMWRISKAKRKMFMKFVKSPKFISFFPREFSQLSSNILGTGGKESD